MRDIPLSTAHNPQKVISILPFIRKTGTAFDDYATAVMGEAFDSARKDLHDTGQPEIVYEVIARRIIDEAKKGEKVGHGPCISVASWAGNPGSGPQVRSARCPAP